MNYSKFKKLVAEGKANEWRGSDLWIATQKLFVRWIEYLEDNGNKNRSIIMDYLISVVLLNCCSLKDVETNFMGLSGWNKHVYELLNNL